MSATWRAALRAAMISAGGALVIASLLAMRREDWPIYLVFSALSMALFRFYVEVVRGVPFPMPLLATTLGFLYLGGLPIIALTTVPGLVAALARGVLPRQWREQVPRQQTGMAESATYLLGLAVRWWIVSLLVPGLPPTAYPWAIAAAEIGGYVAWGVFAIAPIYPDRPFLVSSEGGFRMAMNDIWLVIAVAQTPFVFLISYGYQAEGLPGAAAWSLSTLGIHFMMKRLTERRLTVEEQNRRLETLNRELEHRERLSAIGKMSSIVSHQILQQLGVIGLYADLIRNADRSDGTEAALAQTRANAAAIEGALTNVNRVLSDLLVFSRDLRLNLYEHQLPRLIDECVEECTSLAGERHVTVTVRCPGELTVTLDKLKMKQVIVNLLRNAIQASPQGGEVVVGAAQHDGRVEVAVSDQGDGVPEADRDSIFTPFFTTKENGTGLGLAIAREFTAAHGGQLFLRDGGTGATFVVDLPSRAGQRLRPAAA
jgi:signal transduction histidine kinase